jgi:hypothetical protein
MTARSDIERVLDSFLAEGPEDVSDRAVLRALTAIDRTPQRRGLLAPWRHIRMHAPARLALMAAAVVIAAGGALYVLGPRPQAGGPAATPTAAPSPSPSPVAAAPSDDAGPPFHTATWTRFTTSRYGYTVAWPNNAYWIYSPASEELAAFVVVGNRLYVFAESDARQPELFSAYLSTVKLPGETPGQS